MSRMDECLRYLDEHGVPYELIRHERVSTISECEIVARKLGAIVPRNMFLTPRNEACFVLYTCHPDTLLKSGQVSRAAGCSRLQMASEDKLEMLGTFPGAVSPLGLIFDNCGKIKFVMDKKLLNEEYLVFHPVDNTASVKLSLTDFTGIFLPSCGHNITLCASAE